MANAGARSIILGCYAEIDQWPAEVERLTLVIGGSMEVALSSAGQHLEVDNDATLLRRCLEVWNRKDNDLPQPRKRAWVRTRLGAPNEAGVALQVVNEDEPAGWTLQLQYNQDKKRYELCWTNPSYSYMIFSTSQSTEFGSTDDESADS